MKLYKKQTSAEGFSLFVYLCVHLVVCYLVNVTDSVGAGNGGEAPSRHQFLSHYLSELLLVNRECQT